MRLAQSAAVVGIAVLCCPMLPSQASPKASPQTASVPISAKAVPSIAFEADLAHAAPVAKSLKTGSTAWHCTTTHCSGTGPGTDAAALCKALAAQVGALKNFSAAGRAIDMRTCPAPAPLPVASVAQVAPANKIAAPVSIPGAPPAAHAAGSTGSTSATGLHFTTPAITLTGTGVLAAEAPRANIAFTTPAITLTGTGAEAVIIAPARAGIAFTTDTFRLTGHP